MSDREQMREMFDHIIFMHGYLLGALMKGGRSAAEALAETEPMRANARRLAQQAGFTMPDCFAEAEL